MSDTFIPATNQQCWALYCITKKDYRTAGLSVVEASELIKKLNDEKGYKVPKVNKSLDLFNKAKVAGEYAMRNCTPTPMVVCEHSNMLDDTSPIKKEWFVEGGCCGFAWVWLKLISRENKEFISDLKKAGLAGERAPWSKDSYKGGYSFWVHEGGQSMARKEAYASAFASVLNENGIKCYSQSRID